MGNLHGAEFGVAANSRGDGTACTQTARGMRQAKQWKDVPASHVPASRGCQGATRNSVASAANVMQTV